MKIDRFTVGMALQRLLQGIFVTCLIVIAAFIFGSFEVDNGNQKTLDKQIIPYDKAIIRLCQDFEDLHKRKCDRQETAALLQRLWEGSLNRNDARYIASVRLIEAGYHMEAAGLLRQLGDNAYDSDKKKSSLFYSDAGFALIAANLVEAMSSYRKALQIDSTNADAYIGLSKSLQLGGSLEEAIAILQRAVEYKSTGKDQTLNLTINIDLTFLFYCVKNYAEANRYNEAAIKIAKDNNITIYNGRLFIMIALIQEKFGQIDSAKKSYKRLIEDKSLNNTFYLSVAGRHLGDIFLSENRLDEALVAYRAALKIDREQGNREGQFYQYLKLGDTLFSKGELKLACEQWQLAEQLPKDKLIEVDMNGVNSKLKRNACAAGTSGTSIP